MHTYLNKKPPAIGHGGFLLQSNLFFIDKKQLSYKLNFINW